MRRTVASAIVLACVAGLAGCSDGDANKAECDSVLAKQREFGQRTANSDALREINSELLDKSCIQYG
jgi:hypothetical protein